MKIEYLIKGDNLKKDLNKLIPKDIEKIKIASSYKKLDRKNNYHFSIECDKTTEYSAKELSATYYKIKQLLNENNTKYIVLSDEVSKFFAGKLYPLVQNFELQLRKLLYFSLFGLDEKSEKEMLNNIKKSMLEKNKLDKNKEKYLELSSLKGLLTFLFGNNRFIADANKIVSDHTNDDYRFGVKSTIIEKLSELNETTVWDELYKDTYGNSILRNHYKEIPNYRNRVMHFQTISYTEYEKAKKVLRTTNKDLSNQISKCIVLDLTKERAELVVSNSEYMLDLESIIANVTKAVSSIGDSIVKLFTEIDYDGLYEGLSNVSRLFSNKESNDSDCDIDDSSQNIDNSNEDNPINKIQ